MKRVLVLAMMFGAVSVAVLTAQTKQAATGEDAVLQADHALVNALEKCDTATINKMLDDSRWSAPRRCSTAARGTSATPSSRSNCSRRGAARRNGQAACSRTTATASGRWKRAITRRSRPRR